MPTQWPSSSIPDVYPGQVNAIAHQKRASRMFLEVLFTIAELWMGKTQILINRRMDKYRHIHKTEYYTLI